MFKNIIDSIINFITDPIYLYRKRKEEAAEAAGREFLMKATLRDNRNSLIQILKDFPEEHMLVIQLTGGHWSYEDIQDAIPKQVSKAIEKNSWSYLLGSGVITLDPDIYERSPARIAEVLWEPHTELDGNTILWWQAVKKEP